MNRKTRTAVAALTSLALLGGTALAGERHGGRIFERLDGNNDGVVTFEEARAHADERFARKDSDGDGYIDGSEMHRERHRRLGRALWLFG